MEYTTGWRAYKWENQWRIEGQNGENIAFNIPLEANAHLIAAAPLGYKLAEQVVRTSATWIDEGRLEIGEGDYLLIKKMALELLAKAAAKCTT